MITLPSSGSKRKNKETKKQTKNPTQKQSSKLLGASDLKSDPSQSDNSLKNK